jgi:ribosome-associated toxin RatA of RatAB toxin-antitoxin module
MKCAILALGLTLSLEVRFHMPVINQSCELPFSCEQVYNLINDIEKYHEFLPYLSHGVINSCDNQAMEASLFIKIAGMQKSFTTRNTLEPFHSIKLSLVDGPFKYLNGAWDLQPTATGCNLLFSLDFEFSGEMIARFVAPVFEKIVNDMVDAFYKRAHVVYQ